MKDLKGREIQMEILRQTGQSGKSKWIFMHAFHMEVIRQLFLQAPCTPVFGHNMDYTHYQIQYGRPILARQAQAS